MDRSENQSTLVDRVWLEKTYLPSLSGKILFVGVRPYTSFYHELVSKSSQFITIDKDPGVVNYGSPFFHITDDIEKFLENNFDTYNHISFNGMCGLPHVMCDKDKIIKIVNLCIDRILLYGTFQFGSSLETLNMDDMNDIILRSKMKNLSVITQFVCRPSDRHSEMFTLWGSKKNESN